MMPGVRAVLFDFHETLITADRWYAMETGGFAMEIFQALNVWNGMPAAEERERATYADARMRAIARDTGIEYGAAEVAGTLLTAVGAGGRYGEAAIGTAVSELFRSYVSDVRMKSGVREGLRSVAALGFRMGVLSNARYGPFLHWALEAHGIRRYFECVVVSADVGLRKPRPEIFEAALKAVRLTPAETAYVGNDFLKDVVGAKLAGLRAVWIPDARAHDDRPYTRVQPDAVIEQFEALPELLAAWRTETPR